jgi:hypothetical protein
VRKVRGEVMGMRQKGIAVVAALSLVAVMALLSLAMVHSALGSLRTGGDLLAKAQARQLAEAGLDQGIAFLASLSPKDIPQDQVSLSGSLSTGSYQVALSCAQVDPKRFNCEVRSTGQSGRGTHRAKALVEVGLGNGSLPVGSGSGISGIGGPGMPEAQPAEEQTAIPATKADLGNAELHLEKAPVGVNPGNDSHPSGPVKLGVDDLQAKDVEVIPVEAVPVDVNHVGVSQGNDCSPKEETLVVKVTSRR